MQSSITLVTGAGRGIGRAIAVAMAASGARVAITARSSDQLDNTAKEIEAAGGKVLSVADDLSDRQAPARIVQRVREFWGPIEVLVNNAGIGSSIDPRPLPEFDDSIWDLTLAVNVTAPYLLTKYVLPDMLRASWGRIINISSVNSQVPALHGAAYTVSKHALAGLTRSTAKDVGDKGITCNAICPGVTATEMNDKRLAYDSRRLNTPVDQLQSQASPLGRRILPDEISPLAVFLASDAARAINGQLLNVCGGLVFG